ncbi:hypothetical protein BX666DRAFT_1514788 [Dichotomocladium elegans]|nr:hypothetical protein BX666DRAFT_1514788 [Dichotomocladium elegans]
MPTLLSTSRSEPFPIATMGDDDQQQASYKELIRQLAAQAPKPYGAIPPLLKKRKKKNAKHQRSSSSSEKSKSPTTRAARTPPLPPPPPLPLLPQLQEQDAPSPSRTSSEQQRKPMRRMSHVEDWIVVDSKESLPDEEELVIWLNTDLASENI